MAVEKNPNIKNPEAPFIFINIFEIAEEDIDPFVSDWKSRSKIVAQQPGFISADLQKSLLPDNKFQIINVAHWQSYDGWVASKNDPIFAEQLSTDIDHVPNMKINRGFYRPVASCTHIYD